MAGADRVEQVAQALEQQILAGELSPGDLLPPERELGARLGVSRSVVREAIKRLQSLDLVSSVQGSGTRVQIPSHRPLRIGYERLLRHQGVQLHHLAVARLPLETTIASLAALARSDEQLNQLDATQTRLGDPQTPLEDQIQADLRFHSLLAEATGNPIFQIILSPIQELLIESRRTTLAQFGAALAHAHHGRILAAVRAGDPAEASRAMEDHLRKNYEHLASPLAPQASP